MDINKSVFVDTSGFKALIDQDDDFHQSAVKIWHRLQKENTELITTNYILDETFTLIRAKNGLKIALKFKDYLAESAPIITIERVLSVDEAASWQWFVKNWGHLSFTDCSSFAVMKRLKLRRVFTFDHHFSRAGFKVEK